MELYDVIKSPAVTEKGTLLRELQGKYLFKVHPKANKYQIKGAVEKLFNVHVTDVHTLIARGKKKRVGANVGRKSNWKKAYVTIKAGEKIEIFEGV